MQIRTTRTDNSVQTCDALCAGYPFFYLVGNECGCSYFIDNHYAGSDGDCRKPCPGNSQQFCGDVFGYEFGSAYLQSNSSEFRIPSEAFFLSSGSWSMYLNEWNNPHVSRVPHYSNGHWKYNATTKLISLAYNGSCLQTDSSPSQVWSRVWFGNPTGATRQQWTYDPVAKSFQQVSSGLYLWSPGFNMGVYLSATPNAWIMTPARAQKALYQ